MEWENLKILYECRHGSHAYGLATPESDLDLKGFCVAPKSSYIGFLNTFHQKEENHPNDRVVYDLKKFFKLAADCNPNIIEVLFCDEEDILTSTESGLQIRYAREMFMSKKARFTFMGYAFAQLKRIRSHRHWLLNPPAGQPKREDYGLPDDKKLVTMDQAGAFLSVLNSILKDSLEEANLSQETLNELRGVNTIGLLQRDLPDAAWRGAQKLTGASDNFVEAMMNERRYKAAFDNWKSYCNWKKTRNPARAKLEAEAGHDSKHSSHLVRLVRMGEEIMTGKGVIVKRPDRDELLAIKRGEVPFEEIEKIAEGMDKRMDEYYRTSTLPREPNRKKLDELCQDIMMREVFNGK